MSEANEHDVFGFGGTIQETQKKLQALGKEQSIFFTDLMEKNMKFQKDQFDLLSKIVENQVDHNNKIIQNYVKIASAGVKTTTSK